MTDSALVTVRELARYVEKNIGEGQQPDRDILRDRKSLLAGIKGGLSTGEIA